jgi:flagellar basal-body rod protein FlgG
MEQWYALTASGLQVAERELGATAAAVANAATPGYGRTVLALAAGLPSLSRPANTVLLNQVLPPDLVESTGAAVAGAAVEFSGGVRAGAPLSSNLAIAGAGFFVVRRPNGQIAYTRNGAFAPDAQGRLTLPDGSQLVPPLTVPSGWTLTIKPGGVVEATSPQGTAQVVGQLQLAAFANPGGLLALGGGLWAPTPASGPARLGPPGQGGLGNVQAGALNTSGVSLTALLPTLVRWQAVYGANADALKVEQAATQALNNMP